MTSTLEVPPELLRLSWSRLKLHDECPAKGDLMRRHKPSAQNIRSYVHGTAVDIAMRRWLLQEDPEAGWMRAQIDAIFKECTEHSDEGFVHWKTVTDRAETLDMCRELVVRLEEILKVYCLPFEWQPAVRFEVPVEVTGPDGLPRMISIIGEMDLLVRDGNGDYAVWDLKATRNEDYYRKVLGQLAFYALAVMGMHGRMPARTGLIQPMCTQRVLPVTVDAAAVRQMAGRIEKTARDIWAGKLAPKQDRSDCTGQWGCPVLHACPAFKMGSRPGRVGAAQ